VHSWSKLPCNFHSSLAWCLKKDEPQGFEVVGSRLSVHSLIQAAIWCDVTVQPMSGYSRTLDRNKLSREAPAPMTPRAGYGGWHRTSLGNSAARRSHRNLALSYRYMLRLCCTLATSCACMPAVSSVTAAVRGRRCCCWLTQPPSRACEDGMICSKRRARAQSATVYAAVTAQRAGLAGDWSAGGWVAHRCCAPGIAYTSASPGDRASQRQERKAIWQQTVEGGSLTHRDMRNVVMRYDVDLTEPYCRAAKVTITLFVSD